MMTHLDKAQKMRELEQKAVELLATISQQVKDLEAKPTIEMELTDEVRQVMIDLIDEVYETAVQQVCDQVNGMEIEVDLYTDGLSISGTVEVPYDAVCPSVFSCDTANYEQLLDQRLLDATSGTIVNPESPTTND